MAAKTVMQHCAASSQWLNEKLLFLDMHMYSYVTLTLIGFYFTTCAISLYCDCFFLAMEITEYSSSSMKEDEMNSSGRLSSSKREGSQLSMGKPL